MDLEIKINERTLKVKLIKQEKNFVTVDVNDKIYNIDIEKVSENSYSIINQGKSHVVDLAPTEDLKRYMASTYFNNYNIQIIDAQTRAKELRKGSYSDIVSKIILSPMPGRVVKILTTVGEEVKIGQTLIVVEAMKMQSEYKSTINSTVKKIAVNEGNTINAGELLIELN